MTNTTQTAAEAIETSIRLDTIVTWQGDAATLLDYASENGYETDGVQVEPTKREVWGWTESTPDGEQDWRVDVETAK